MRRGTKALTATALIGLAAVTVPLGWVWAQEQQRILVVPGQQETTTTIYPSPPVAVTPQTLQADEIKAQQVRAHTIYANRIEANEIRGMIHQTRGVKVRNTDGDIKAPDVTAAVIYADRITANLVVAENVYVRDIRRR